MEAEGISPLFRSMLVSYQKKDWQGSANQSVFWNDNEKDAFFAAQDSHIYQLILWNESYY